MSYNKQAIEDFNRDHLEQYINDITTPDRRAGKNFYVCPVCGSGSNPNKGHDAAFSYNWNNGKPYCHCFSCQGDHETWDLFSLKARVEGTTNSQAIENAFWEAGLPDPLREADQQQPGSNTSQPPAVTTHQEASAAQPPKNEADYIDACHKALYAEQGAQTLDYLHKRGFSDDTIKRYKLGYDQDSAWPLVIPYPGKLYHFSRVVTGSAEIPKYHAKGQKPDFFTKEPAPGDVTFIVEGQLDALSIAQAAREMNLDNINALAMDTSSKNNIYTIKAAVFIVACDNDKTGNSSRPKIIKQLNDHKRLYTVAQWTSDDLKDANEMLEKRPDFFMYDVKKNYDIAIANIRKDLTKGVLERLVSDIEHGNTKKAISTGFSGLDDALGGGLYPGLYFLGAVSSIGKTALLLQIADQIAKQGKPVLYYSLEMSEDEMVARSLSRYTGISNPFSALTVNDILYSDYEKMSHDEIDKLLDKVHDAKKKYESDKIGDNMEIVAAVGNIKVSDIKQRMSAYNDLLGIVPVVFIDYLQLIAPEEEDRRATDKQIVDKTVLELKRLSRDLNTPIIAISSINRTSYVESVTMSSFKESGAIEYGSDVLLGLQPAGMLKYVSSNAEKKYNGNIISECKAEEKERHLVVNVLKNRNGRTGKQALFNNFPTWNQFSETGVTWEDVPKYENDKEEHKAESEEEIFKTAYEVVQGFNPDKGATIQDLAGYLGMTERQIKNRIKKYGYQVDENGQVTQPTTK